MIQRLRGRAAFRRLRTHGTRRNGSALWCTWCPYPTTTTPSPPTIQVGYVIGRAYGQAVLRNRTRRQLRAIMHQLSMTMELPPGLLLIGAKPNAPKQTFDQLRGELIVLMSQIQKIPAGSNT